jgi:hypothetical protein
LYTPVKISPSSFALSEIELVGGIYDKVSSIPEAHSIFGCAGEGYRNEYQHVKRENSCVVDIFSGLYFTIMTTDRHYYEETMKMKLYVLITCVQKVKCKFNQKCYP